MAQGKSEIILGIATILITLIYGSWGIYLTNKSNNLNQQMLELSKTQTALSEKQIELSNIQIKSANYQLAIAELGNMNTLYEKADEINTSAFGLKINNASVLASIKNMLEGEINNPYLNSHTDLQLKWKHAYDMVADFEHRFDPHSPLSILKNDYKDKENMFIRVCQTVTGTVVSVKDSITEDRIKKGFDVELKAGDLVTLSAYPEYQNVVYKVIKPDNGEYLCVRQSKDSIPNLPDTLHGNVPWLKKLGTK